MPNGESRDVVIREPRRPGPRRRGQLRTRFTEEGGLYEGPGAGDGAPDGGGAEGDLFGGIGRMVKRRLRLREQEEQEERAERRRARLEARRAPGRQMGGEERGIEAEARRQGAVTEIYRQQAARRQAPQRYLPSGPGIIGGYMPEYTKLSGVEREIFLPKSAAMGFTPKESAMAGLEAESEAAWLDEIARGRRRAAAGKTGRFVD